MFSTNPLEIKTLTKDIHLCSFFRYYTICVSDITYL